MFSGDGRLAFAKSDCQTIHFTFPPIISKLLVSGGPQSTGIYTLTELVSAFPMSDFLTFLEHFIYIIKDGYMALGPNF